MLDASYYASLGLADVLDKVLAGPRLSAEDGMALFACPDITAVGALAHHARCRMHGDKTSYVVNRQINYTNVCVNGCVFCAFRRDREEDQGAFCLSTEEVLERLRAADATPLHLDELHIVGGCHPSRPFEWVLDTLRASRPPVWTPSPAAAPRSSTKACAPRSAPTRPVPPSGCASPARPTAWASRPTAPCSTVIWRPAPCAWTISAACANSRTRAAVSPASSPCPS